MHPNQKTPDLRQRFATQTATLLALLLTYMNKLKETIADLATPQISDETAAHKQKPLIPL